MKTLTNSRWALPFLLLLGISLGGLFAAQTPTPAPDASFDAANLAWMLTATGLVLLMTPGLSFFYGGMVSKKKRHQHHAAKLHSLGGD